MQPGSGLRIIFAGTPEFAAQHLQALLHSQHQVVAVYTQPDRPAGRGKKLSASPVKSLALQFSDVPVYQPQTLKNSDVQQNIIELNADVMVVVAYGLLLPQAVLDAPKFGCINVHASLLPRWRGAAPIQRAIAAGDSVTGITIMQMEAGLDTGPMLLTKTCDIHAQDTSATLHDRLAAMGPNALLETLDLIQQGKITATAQDNKLATYAEKILKAEAYVDWRESAQMIERKVRAFIPFPVAYTELNNQRIKIFHAEIIAADKNFSAPGTIFCIDSDSGICVSCGEHSALRITHIQLPGKTTMSVYQVLLGHPTLFAVGQCFQSPAA